MWVVGVGVALIPIYCGIRSLLTGHATLFGRHGSRLELTGSAAVAMAIAYLAVGAFIHAHWFWGLHPKLARFSPMLKALAVLVFLGGLGYAGYSVLAS